MARRNHIEYRGAKYYELPNGYFRSTHKGERKGEFLHRAVWRNERGPIPPDWNVHHKDGAPKSTVDPNDLECMSHSDHARLHYRETENIVRPRAAECNVCGKEFQAKIYNQLFCSSVCRRKNPRYEHDCHVCGKRFRSYRDKPHACSVACSSSAMRKRFCKGCNGPIPKERYNFRYCSVACRETHNPGYKGGIYWNKSSGV